MCDLFIVDNPGNVMCVSVCACMSALRVWLCECVRACVSMHMAHALTRAHTWKQKRIICGKEGRAQKGGERKMMDMQMSTKDNGTSVLNVILMG